ncbi:MAG TPA: FAD-binding protein [Pseudonocardiaceae bacterium]|nr:FAD-binding protein [Pseudonocardiaceae bacterium]
MKEEVSALTVARELADQLDPSVVVTSGSAYEDTHRIWNGAVTSRPALVVRGRTQHDVQAAVRAARRRDVPLSVRSGGHDWAGRSLRHHGLVIDLTGMRQVTVDAQTRVADVIGAAASHALSAATGTVGSVGMAGLILGGGYGPLSGPFGLALDNLLSADLVLADGRLITVDEHHDVQQPGVQPELNLRGLFTADDEGRFWFRSVVPRHYPIPDDGPVGHLLHATGRHPNRPAYIHFIGGCPGYQPVTTHVFLASSPYLDSDAVFGVKASLIRPVVEIDDAARAKEYGVPTPFQLIEFDLVLTPA